MWSFFIGFLLLHVVLDIIFVRHLERACPDSYLHFGGRQLRYSLPLQAQFMRQSMLLRLPGLVTNATFKGIAYLQFFVNWALTLLFFFFGIKELFW